LLLLPLRLLPAAGPASAEIHPQAQEGTHPAVPASGTHAQPPPLLPLLPPHPLLVLLLLRLHVAPAQLWLSCWPGLQRLEPLACCGCRQALLQLHAARALLLLLQRLLMLGQCQCGCAHDCCWQQKGGWPPCCGQVP
jgi:hypothetical protein